MKKFFLLVLLSFFFILGCNNDNCEMPQYCNSINPLEELSWLKIIYENIKNNNDTVTKIVSYKSLDGQEFIDITKESIGTIYDCSGEVLCEYGGFAPTPCDTILNITGVREYRVLYPE